MTNTIPKFSNLFLKIFFFVIITVCSSIVTFAQIQVDLSFPQQQYLAYEPIIAVVKISNVSGQTLNFKKDDNWLDFTMETKTGRIIPKDAEIPQQEDFSIQSGEVGILRVDIQPCYNAVSPDRYTVVANVRIKGWDKVFTSKEETFDIVTGIKIWEKEFGVPSADGENPPEVKKYTLLLANFKDHLRLYFRLSNAGEDKVDKMTYMGNLTSIGKPEANLDKFNNLHVLYQVGAKAFRYSVFSPEGRLFIKETHDYTISRPRLWLDQDGRIYVRGGARRITSEDIPGTDKKSKN